MVENVSTKHINILVNVLLPYLVVCTLGVGRAHNKVRELVLTPLLHPEMQNLQAFF